MQYAPKGTKLLSSEFVSNKEIYHGPVYRNNCQLFLENTNRKRFLE